MRRRVLRVIRSHQARPVAEPTEDRIPRADIDFATGIVHLDGVPWLRRGRAVPAEAVASDARILADYLDSFLAFFGNAAGAVEVYWAFLVWLYAAPAAPYLRQAAVPVGIDPWVYPVYAVLFGRSSGGKTLFTRIAARSMFGFEKMIRSGQFTANRALGLRDRLGAIPLLIDDVTRDKFTSHVPDLVRTDQEMSAQYAPIVLTTNRDVSTIPPDLTKRMVTCHIDAAIPENRSVTERDRTARPEGDRHRAVSRLPAASDPGGARHARRDRRRGRGFPTCSPRPPRSCAAARRGARRAARTGRGR